MQPRRRSPRRRPCWPGRTGRRGSWRGGPTSWSSSARICGTPTWSSMSRRIPELMELSYQPRERAAAGGARALLPHLRRRGDRRPPIRPWPMRRGSSAAGRFRAGPASAATSATRRRPATRSPPLIALTARLRHRRAGRDARGAGRGVLHRAGQERARPRRVAGDARVAASGRAQRLGLRAVHSAQRDGHRGRGRGVVGAARRRPARRSRRPASAWARSPRRRGLAAEASRVAGRQAGHRGDVRPGRRAGQEGRHRPSATCAAPPSTARTWSACSSSARWRGRSSGPGADRPSVRRHSTAELQGQTPCRRKSTSRRPSTASRPSSSAKPRQSLLEVLRDTLQPDRREGRLQQRQLRRLHGAAERRAGQ